jgi:hypothetical protein
MCVDRFILYIFCVNTVLESIPLPFMYLKCSTFQMLFKILVKSADYSTLYNVFYLNLSASFVIFTLHHSIIMVEF